MTAEEKDSIAANLSEIEKYEIDDIVGSLAAESSNDNLQVFAGLNIIELASFHKKIVSKVKVILGSGEWAFYPNEYLLKFNQYNLAGVVSQLRVALDSRNLTELSVSLSGIAAYLIQHGLWQDVSYDLHQVKESGKKFSEFEASFALQEKRLFEQKEAFGRISNDIEAVRNDLLNLVTTKTAELNQIAQALNSANSDSGRVNELLQSTTAAETRIQGFVEQESKHLSEINVKIAELNTIKDELQNELGKFKQDGAGKLTLVDTELQKYNELLAQANLQVKFFSDKEQYLNELTGFAAGTSLFHTFKARKDELIGPVAWWRTAVIWTSILGILGILAIFYLGLDKKLEWEAIVVSSVKSIPLLVILYFVIRQYNRERTFQEEYAFKSAVALTVKAYSDLVSTPAEKEKLIYESVMRVFQSPAIMKEKRSFSIFPGRAKETTELIKELTETFSTLKSK